MGRRDGVPVMFFIGLGVPLTYWGDPLIRSFVDNGYRVNLPDNRDAGLSERFSDYGVESLSEALELVSSGEQRELGSYCNASGAAILGVLQARRAR